MDAEFTELSYGFAFTHELINNSIGIENAAVFPSQIAEGREGGGYDMEIQLSGYPLFIQFKLSEYMISSSANEWHLYNQPYYRFKIRSHKKSQQHDLLLQLEDEMNNVFYVAPEFWKLIELNQFFMKEEILYSSAFFRPSSIGTINDDNEHSIVFQRHSTYGYFCSNPTQLKIERSKILRMNFDKENFLSDKESFINFGIKMINITKDICNC